MTSCDLISEGFDVPGIVGALLLRPTLSLGLYLQQVGRALRISEGKSHAVILDHASNSKRHGMPDDDRAWTLDGRDKKKKAKADPDDIAIRQCKACYAVSKATAIECRECHEPFEIKPRQVEQVAGDLAEVVRAPTLADSRKHADGLDDLVRLGKARGMKHPYGWAKHVLAARARR